ncbi:MAG: glycosyltransferase family 9 protein [Candidatus Eremiobacteraeota bacterium]|nr:glycosyltransferase family 9 protein [Candidatus Eremiobacteraeota bacterium]MBC5801969.1 glycosyltransferase family 9 protein [Candidatus Eremiobacteraeota bacterium]MBC5820712.1 glycosyltransferase family 9 protein [Candidatus Eremiobacteraeota bacterium]
MKRFLAIRQDNNGDVTLVGPALRALAAHGRVTLVCGPSGEGAAGLLPGVDDALVVRADWIEGTPQPIDAGRIAADVARYAAAEADEAFIFTSFHQSPLPTALLLRLAGVGSIAAVSVDYPGSLLDWRVTVSDDLHEVERALALVAAAGYRLPPDDDGRLRYRALPSRDRRLPPDYVVVQPGASVPARAWDPAKLRALVHTLCRSGTAVVIVGSAGERELTHRVMGDSDALDLCGTTTYAEFAAVIRDARALVVGNTSGIHIAGAVGTPVVTIFPPTVPLRRFAPWRVPSVALGDQTIGCAGCRARSCPFPAQPCTGCVGVEDVLAALATLTSPAGAVHYGRDEVPA